MMDKKVIRIVNGNENHLQKLNKILTLIHKITHELNTNESEI